MAACFELMGARFELETPAPDLLTALSSRLPPPKPRSGLPIFGRRYAVRAASQAETLFVVHRGSRKPIVVPDLEIAADLIVSDVQRVLALRARGLVFLHAGAVVWRGRGILLPGRSGSGKSSLVAALLQAGAQYLSDELAVLDESGQVHPYPRHLALRRSGGIERVRPEAIGTVAGGPAPVAAIALLRYRPGARWSLKRISPGAAVLAVLRNVVAARSRLELARRALVPLARDSVVWTGVRGEADQAARALLEEIDGAVTLSPSSH